MLFGVETVLLDFESTTIPSRVASWLHYSKTGSSAVIWGAANPDPDGINSTSGCYKIVKTNADPYWTGLEVTMASTQTISASNQYLHVLVYKNSSSRIALTYTPVNGSQSSDAWQVNPVTGNWIDYVLSIPVGTKLETFALKIGDDAGVYYFDQIVLSDSGTPLSNTMVKVLPDQKFQTIEGWGASLCWWANVMGGFTEAKVKTVCDWIVDPNGLNMNIFRFNIGGGDNPGHHHMRSDGGNMPGYKTSASAPYNWNQDANQRRILQQLIASRKEKAGLNDIQIVAFSNSPPYWMTRSACTAGSTEGNVCNLKADMYDAFADYLTEVTRYYHDSLGFSFNYLEPFNEPDETWWKALSGQEGCYYSNSDQIKMIRALYKSLQQKNMLTYCRITANDANTIDHAYSALQAYQSAGDIVPMIDLVSVHSYGGTKRSLLSNWAKNQNKKLWQTESGPLYVGSGYENQIMIMADRVVTDLRDLNCTVWCDWQIAGTDWISNPWSLIAGNYKDASQPVARNTNYYLRAQFSRFIKAGYTLIGSSSANSVAALSPDGKELVIVLSNSLNSKQKFEIDLSAFQLSGKVQQFETLAKESMSKKLFETNFTISQNSFEFMAQPQSVVTFLVSVDQSNSKKIVQESKDEPPLYYSNGFFFNRLDKTENILVYIFDMQGRLMQKITRMDPYVAVKANLYPGMYLMCLEYNGNWVSQKLIVNY